MEESHEAKNLILILYRLPIIIFVEGFVSIAVEILTIRQLLPVAGGSVIVTSLIIGIFLLFLAWGYWQGGKITQQFDKVLRANFIIATLWLGVGLSYSFILLFFLTIQKMVGDHLIYPLIAYLLLITAPITYILGQTVPITMNMMHGQQSIGRIGGNVLGLSTLGSFLGATLTAVFFMEYVGVAWTVVINALLLILLILLMAKNKAAFFKQSVLILIIIYLVYIFNIRVENKLFVLTNQYANYQISENQLHEKILYINNSPSSYINSQNTAAPYIEVIKRILFNDLKLRHSDILVLGAGGFTLSAESAYGNHFTYVDIDKKIKQVVMPQFIRQINGELIIDDARHYIHFTNKQYDVMVIDAYSNMKAIPAHLLTHEYIKDLQKKLKTKGLIIFNIIASPLLADAYSKRIDNTIRSVFKSCMVIPISYDTITNILYVCSNLPNQMDQTIYRDNLNTSTTDSFEW